jgi:hypothetical protein
MNIFIIIFGCLLISVIIYFVFANKKSKNNKGNNCKSDLKSCSAWKNVRTAYIPCIEGVSQKCGPNGQGCQDSQICAEDGCCVQCNSPYDLPDYNTKTCKPDTSGCIPQPNGESGFTTYVCTCADAVTSPATGTCANFNVQYINGSTGELVPVGGDLKQSDLNAICGQGKFEVPQNWTNTWADLTQDKTTLSRICDDDPVKNENTKYSNFTCPRGLQTSSNYECTTSPSSSCTSPTPENQCEVINPTYSCDPDEYPDVNYCGDGTLNCIIKYENGEHKGYNKCLNNRKDPLCTPCCDISQGYQAAPANSTGPLCVQTCVPPLYPYTLNGIDYCIYHDPINIHISHKAEALMCTTPYQAKYGLNGPGTNPNICSCGGDYNNNGDSCVDCFNNQPTDDYSRFPWYRTTLGGDSNGSWCWEMGQVPPDTWYCAGTNWNSPYSTTGKWTKCTSPTGCRLEQGWDLLSLKQYDGTYDTTVQGCSLDDLKQVISSEK